MIIKSDPFYNMSPAEGLFGVLFSSCRCHRITLYCSVSFPAFDLIWFLRWVANFPTFFNFPTTPLVLLSFSLSFFALFSMALLIYIFELLIVVCFHFRFCNVLFFLFPLFYFFNILHSSLQLFFVVFLCPPLLLAFASFVIFFLLFLFALLIVICFYFRFSNVLFSSPSSFFAI